MLARLTMANLATVELRRDGAWPWPLVSVRTDEPVLAAMASQYAGWEVKGERFFAMGSGPMRAAAAREPLFAELGYRELAEVCVGALECAKLPPDAVCRDVAAKCGVAPERLTLCVAATRSIAGTLQVVARSVETALHKLHELKFDLSRVVRGWGTAPLPPLALDDLTAIGRTNDAVLYCGDVTLVVRGDEESLREIGPRMPSSASGDYGRPFGEILAAYGNDFYRVDPLLFSPARVTLIGEATGAACEFGELNLKVLEASFG
jgi:methenyltetrahydromethanopterin cyclohydrolase